METGYISTKFYTLATIRKTLPIIGDFTYSSVIVGTNSRTNVKNFIWIETQSFVVLRKGKTFCASIEGIDLQKYFIDKLCLHPVTVRIRLPVLASIVKRNLYKENDYTLQHKLAEKKS